VGPNLVARLARDQLPSYRDAVGERGKIALAAYTGP